MLNKEYGIIPDLKTSCATRLFHKHEGTSNHIKNAVGYRELKKNLNKIADTLKENARLCIAKYNKKVRVNLFMCLPIDAVLFIAKQELGFRGNDETISSFCNFKISQYKWFPS